MVYVKSEKVKKNFYFPEWAWNLLDAESKRLLSRDRLSWATAAAILCFSEQSDDIKAHYLSMVKQREVAQGYMNDAEKDIEEAEKPRPYRKKR